MKMIVYRGPYEALEIDGHRLDRDGEPVELSAEQIRRLRWTRNCQFEIVKPPKPATAKEE